MRRLFTSESVTEGHPDKICDQISDAIVDAVLAQDPKGRVAAETLVKTDFALIAGEISTTAKVDYEALARQVILDIGYDKDEYGFNGSTCELLLRLEEQSPDIAIGVNEALEARDGGTDDLDTIGAGDQGMMFGFACKETKELMPMPISLAHNLTRQLAKVRREGILPYVRPDGKAQVTVEYIDNVPARVDTVVLSTQHDPEVTLEQIREDMIEKVIRPVMPKGFLDERTRYFVNPTGRFVVGGPHGDSGLTGRKIIVDTYGGFARHGGGAFSGKDPTKVDRAGAYAARYVAKNLVAAGLAERCEVQIAYAIGVARPVSILVDTFGTGIRSDEDLAGLVQKEFDLRPAAIIRDLDLQRPGYKKIAAYGHMGRSDLDLTWERTDRADRLRER